MSSPFVRTPRPRRWASPPAIRFSPSTVSRTRSLGRGFRCNRYRPPRNDARADRPARYERAPGQTGTARNNFLRVAVAFADRHRAAGLWPDSHASSICTVLEFHAYVREWRVGRSRVAEAAYRCGELRLLIRRQMLFDDSVKDHGQSTGARDPLTWKPRCKSLASISTGKSRAIASAFRSRSRRPV